MAQAGKPKTNKKATKAVKVASPTGPPLSKEDGLKQAEAKKAADRRQALKDKTAAMLAKKKANAEEQKRLNEDVTVLNEVSG
jgi:hypothetical protein